MYKNLLSFTFLFFFVFSLGMIAQEKAPVIEHLVWESGGVFNYTILDSPAHLEFESEELFLTFQIPPSPKSDLIIFDYGCQTAISWWVGYTPQSFWSGFYLRFYSEVIPDDMYVDMPLSIDGIGGIIWTDDAWHRTDKSNYKWALRRDDFLRDYVFRPLEIKYKDTGEYVPDEIANNVLNDLIDNGFDVEASVWGMVEGAKEFFLVSGWMHVTRAAKK